MLRRRESKRIDVDYVASTSLQARRSTLLAAGCKKIRDDIRHGNQSTFKHSCEWPWAKNGTASEFQATCEVVKWTVPMDGLYLIGANGGSGASTKHVHKKLEGDDSTAVLNEGGKGAMLCCLLSLKKGQDLAILVGERGHPFYLGTSTGGDRMVSGGGGGASSVALWHKSGVRAPILVAGGGGGATCTAPGLDATTHTDGMAATSTGYMVGARGGLGTMRAKEGHNAITGGSGRGGDAFFGGGGAGYYEAGGADVFFQQAGTTPAIGATARASGERPRAAWKGNEALVTGAAPVGGGRRRQRKDYLVHDPDWDGPMMTRSAYDVGGTEDDSRQNRRRLLLQRHRAAATAASTAPPAAAAAAERRHYGGFGGGGAPCASTMGGGGGGGYGGGGGGMHGGGGGGSFISKAPGVAHLMAKIGWVGDGIVRIESISGPELSKLGVEQRARLDELIKVAPDTFRIAKSGSMEIIF